MRRKDENGIRSQVEALEVGDRLRLPIANTGAVRTTASLCGIETGRVFQTKAYREAEYVEVVRIV